MNAPARTRIGTWIATPALNLLEDGERSLRVEPKAMDVLAYLAARPGQVVSVDELLREVWRGVVVTDASVYMAIKQLRRALAGSGEDTQYVETIPKRGYRLTAPVEPLSPEPGTLVVPVDEAAPPMIGNARSTSARRRYPATAVASVLVVMLAAAAWWLGRASTGRDDANAPAGRQVFEFSVPGLEGFAVSPDGRHIAYAARTGLRMSHLYVRSLDSLQPRMLPGTEGALGVPFWSPDSRHVAYGVIRVGQPQFLIPAPRFQLARVARDDGSPQVLADGLPVGADGAWGAEDVIVFDGGTGLERISATTGGGRAPLTQLEPNENTHVQPSFLPDGRRFLFTTAFGKPGLYVQSLDSAERTQILPQSATAIYANGYLLFNRGSALMAQRFDAERLALQGAPVRIADGVLTDPAGVYAFFSVSKNGVLAYIAGDRLDAAMPVHSPSQLAWYDRSGKRLGVVGEPGAYRGFALSHDRKRIVVHRHEGLYDGDLWMLDPDRNTFMRFTDGPRHEAYPVFSPDDSWVLYSGGDYDLYQKPSSGVGVEELLLDTLRFALPSDWARDGTVLVTHTQTTTTHADISALSPGDRSPVLLEGTQHNEVGGTLSPDGRWLAFASDESGRYEIYVVPYPNRTRKIQVSSGGGEGPQWSANGELFYYTVDGAIMTATTDTADADNPFGRAVELFRANLLAGNHFGAIGELPHVPYAVTADGERFLINERVGGNGADDYVPVEQSIVVILNWLAAVE